MSSCPTCRLLLETVDWHGIPVQACRSCGGAWFRARDLGAALGERRADLDELNALYTGAGGGFAFAGLSAPCPECGTELITQALAIAPDAAARACPKCGGMWLDPQTRSRAADVRPLPGAINSAPSSVFPANRRWCTRCGNDFPEAEGYCPDCKVELVDGLHEVECPSCGIRTQVSRGACTVCGTSLGTKSGGKVGEALTAEPSDPVMAANEEYAKNFRYGHMAREPQRKIAVLTCMDARMRLYEMLGMEAGDLNVIRNAGGIVTEDSLRSLILSHHLLGTQEFYIINHTDCGLLNITDEDFRAKLVRETGASSAIPATFHPIRNLEENVREQMRRLRSHPWIPASIRIRGFVYDVRTGRLGEVSLL